MIFNGVVSLILNGNEITNAYLGTIPLFIDNNGTSTLSTSTTMSVSSNIVIPAKATLSSTSTLYARGVLFQFEVILTSAVEPTLFTYTGGVITTIDLGDGRWSLRSYDNITYFALSDGITLDTTTTAVEVVKGDTLTTLAGFCYGASSVIEFTWYGPCNATLANSMMENSGIYEFPTMDVSNITNFTNMFAGCTNLVFLPYMDTSSGTTFDGFINGCTQLLCLTNCDTTSAGASTNMFNNTINLIYPDTTDQTLLAAGGYNWVNMNPCGIDQNVFTYLLIEDLITDGTYYYVQNSEDTINFDGGLEHSSQSSFPIGSPWNPVQDSNYQKDGIINLRVVGDGTRQINTHLTLSPDLESTFFGTYNLSNEGALEYVTFVVHYKGNGTADVYNGTEKIGLHLVQQNIPYVPPIGDLKIYEYSPPLPIVDFIGYTMGDFYTV